MSEYKLWHMKSRKWVDELLLNYGDYGIDEPYISNLEFTDEDDEHSKVFDDSKYPNIPKKLEEQMGLTRVYVSGEAYMFYSRDLNSWLGSIDGGTLFETWRENENKYDVYPMMSFRYKSKDAVIIREEATIEWLKENTKLKAVSVDE